MDSSGSVTVRDNISSKQKSYLIIKHPHQDHMPAITEAPGLSCRQRQWYLFKEIRLFIAADKQDIVARQPSVPLPEPITDGLTQTRPRWFLSHKTRLESSKMVKSG
ncbi:hypothetical protein PoB_000927100 [Plakobranchus ocellatus]|uniref:Uncharacterized protein n=1 Tax=Plakobranchus ocellatus TaxID=259542 RepID=A0AAV3YK62_9GAST|nr:hypothetical protein PoB_000927100 [Plakobranchus ocellatus]